MEQNWGKKAWKYTVHILSLSRRFQDLNCKFCWHIRKSIFSYRNHFLKFICHRYWLFSMKSRKARWNPHSVRMKSASQMKLNPSFLPTKSDFITMWFHPAKVGFIPSARTDLVEKEHHLSGRQMVFLFWSGIRESNPPMQLGKLPFYRWTTSASLVGIIANPSRKCNTKNVVRIPLCKRR